MTPKPLQALLIFTCLTLAACRPQPIPTTAEPATPNAGSTLPAAVTAVIPTAEVSLPTATAEPASAEQWSGTITALGGGAQFDDYFTPFSGSPACGIDGENDEIRALIIQSRDSGKSVKISGQLQSDVPDYNGCQFRVSRIEIE